MGKFMIHKCEKCGSEENVREIKEGFHFPCKCHSTKYHSITHYVCEKCADEFSVAPNKRYSFTVAITTFYIFMKAHAKYHKKYKMTLDETTLSPKFRINEKAARMNVHINCTYKTLRYIDKIYQEWMSTSSTTSKD